MHFLRKQTQLSCDNSRLGWLLGWSLTSLFRTRLYQRRVITVTVYVTLSELLQSAVKIRGKLKRGIALLKYTRTSSSVSRLLMILVLIVKRAEILVEDIFNVESSLLVSSGLLTG